MSNLAANVRRLRHAKNWSQAELMRTSGVSSVKLIETGKVLSPRHPHLEALATALGVSVSELFAEPANEDHPAKPNRKTRSTAAGRA